MGKDLKTFTTAEVAKHNSDGDNFLIIDGGVYDVSNFASMHPGGENLLNEIAGTDATETFYGLHRQEVLDKYRPRLLVGYTEEADIPEDDGLTQWGRISGVPYAETFAWRDGFHSPYHTEKHKEFRTYCREFFDKNVREVAFESENSNEPCTPELMQKIAQVSSPHPDQLALSRCRYHHRECGGVSHAE